MDESSYGLIVEGVYDESVFPEFVRKIVSPQVTVKVRVCWRVAQLVKHFPAYLQDFEHVMQGKSVDKALVVRDCRGPDSVSLEREMAQKVRDRQFAFPRGVHFCAVRREMDTWLLADVSAINSVAQERGGRNMPPVQGQLEDTGDPKKKLRGVLSQAGLPYTPKVCAETARCANLEELRYRCPSFRSFERKVLDC